MNILTLLAFVIAGAVFGIAVFTSTDNPRSMLDFHGALIVFGGSIAATAVSYQLDRIIVMFKVFFRRMIFSKKSNYVQIIEELVKLSEAYRSKSSNLQTMIEKSQDIFVRECMTLVIEASMEDASLIKLLRNRVALLYQRYSAEAEMFQGMGKYPPAMGLMGAVLGMIALLGSLGKPGAEKSIGPAMSVALIATFYGIALANLVIIPISENLAQGAKETRLKNSIIVEGIALMLKKTNPIVMVEELNSFLLPHERIDWKKMNAKK